MKRLFASTPAVLILLIGLLLHSQASAQAISGTINTYTAVTGVAGSVVTVASAAGFAPGDYVMIIQMKDADVDQTNTATAGSVNCYNHSGKYEFGNVINVAGNNITLSAAVCRTYNTANAIQLVRVPVYAAPTVTGVVSATPWNGTTGGVVALSTPGTLTLNANIDVSGDGYRGGRTSCNGFFCNMTDYWYTFASCRAAEKGEGISEYIANNRAGRGAQANGGGGGASVNAGGAGGANYGAGGRGGDEWGGCGAPPLGGDAAYAMSFTEAGCERAFMGGGGGGGQGNASEGTDGANGGGLVIIVANAISGNGNQIRSLGLTAGNAVHGGAGGGGAGGSVLLYANSFPTALTVNVTGGKGGDNTGSGGNPVGPGGGGGGGLLWTSLGAVPGTVSLVANGGAVGIMSGGGGSHNAGPGAAGGSRTFLGLPCTSVCGPPCPVLAPEFMSFTGEYQSNGTVRLDWRTDAESNTRVFSVQRSKRPQDFEEIGTVPASGNTTVPTDYDFLDLEPHNGLNYYRLVLVDHDGNTFYSQIVSVMAGVPGEDLLVSYPNPVNRGETFHIEVDASKAATGRYELLDPRGKLVRSAPVEIQSGFQAIGIPTNELATGMYLLRLEYGANSHTIRLMVK